MECVIMVNIIPNNVDGIEATVYSFNPILNVRLLLIHHVLEMVAATVMTIIQKDVAGM